MVYVDADACPVVDIVVDVSRRAGVPVTLLCDTNHSLYSDYAKVLVVDAGADSVDLKLVNLCARGDVVVTQDYGLAAMALARGARVMHQSGMEYTPENIDGLLFERHESRKARMASSKAHLRGPSKRTRQDDAAFRAAFERIIGETIRGGDLE